VDSAFVLDHVRQAITVSLMVAGPLLLTALVVGVLVSVIQAVTQIQEQTLTFVPKLGAMAVVLFVGMPWLMRQLVSYVVELFRSIPGVVS
jgi:flagellar biosynthetic protein FliQ